MVGNASTIGHRPLSIPVQMLSGSVAFRCVSLHACDGQRGGAPVLRRGCCPRLVACRRSCRRVRLDGTGRAIVLGVALLDPRGVSRDHGNARLFRRQSAGHVTRRTRFLTMNLIEAILSLPARVAYHPELDRPALRRLTAGKRPPRRNTSKDAREDALERGPRRRSGRSRSTPAGRAPPRPPVRDPGTTSTPPGSPRRFAGAFESPPGTISGWPQELWPACGDRTLAPLARRLLVS